MKHALISGCSRGIGLALTKALLADGWRVTGVSRTPPIDLPPTTGVPFHWFRTNVAVGAHVDQIAGILDNGAVLDALITCAGRQHPVGPVRRVDPLEWANAVGVNLGGTFRMARLALPYLERSEDARILLFSGGGAFSPRPNFSAYAASKAGVVALMEALSGELADTAISANCVAPGFVATGIHAPTVEAGQRMVGGEEYRAAERPDAGEMDEVVACVRHLLSPHTRGLTGKTIAVPWDDWQSIAPETVPALMRSPAGTRTRHKIPQLSVVVQHPNAVLV